MRGVERHEVAERVGEVDVGEQITEQLKGNDKIGWVFLPEDEARDGLMRGDYYAMFLIPPEFSEDLLSLVSGTYTQPVLEYYVNEKSNGVAPSITDAGASAVDMAVSEAFKKKVGEAASTYRSKERTSLACETRLNSSAASGDGLTSGCSLRAFLR